MRQQGGGENYIIRSLMICALTHYCSGDKIEKNERGWVCSVHGGEKRHVQGFVGET